MYGASMSALGRITSLPYHRDVELFASLSVVGFYQGLFINSSREHLKGGREWSHCRYSASNVVRQKGGVTIVALAELIFQEIGE